MYLISGEKEKIDVGTGFAMDKVAEGGEKGLRAYVCQELDYEIALRWQKDLVAKRKSGEIEDTLILLEHPPTYTMGSDQKWEHLLYPQDFLKSQGFSICKCDRGGDITYHGPGQLVVYPIIRLRDSGLTPIGYVRLLEQIICDVLTMYNLEGQRKEGYPGVWLEDCKICAIGIGISRGVTFHGLALNVNPDLTHFQNIVPCGLAKFGVTSLARELGFSPEMFIVKQQIIASFERNLNVKCRVSIDQRMSGGVRHENGSEEKSVALP
ncbi:lipoyl(octanoyl) transferase LipB [Aneurinibacillus thermoaerophilus]|nr:lipoyl(octanoyl) transferase LipB [Aneurinibacillus thermoaerophilus]